MFRRLSREQIIALAFVVVRTAWCAWRAATQSLVHDEALTFLNFVNGTWSDAYFKYTSNNHVLFSLLAKLSVSIFGVSELTFRLPTVLAGFFLMWGAWRVWELAPSPTARWVAFAVLGLTPPMLDFSVAARGYGLSLALLVWALHAAMKNRTLTAGLLLGLAVSANFTTALPAVGIILAAALLAEGSAGDRVRGLVTMSVSAAAIFVLVCGGALRVVQRGEFYAGAPSLHDSLYNLIFTSIHATPRLGLVGPWFAANVVLYAALPAVGLFLGIRGWLAWRAGDRITPLAPLALALAMAVMFAAHRFLGLLYPVDRTGLPWILLFSMAWGFTVGTTRNIWWRGVNVLAACLLAAQFVTQLHGDYLTVWWYDRSTKDVARRIEADTRGRPARSVAISATWIHQPALEFYRIHDRADAWKPVERLDSTPLTGYDYYVLNQPDTGAPAAHALTVLFSDSFSGVMLGR
jgi:uncharacterized membrane protein